MKADVVMTSLNFLRMKEFLSKFFEGEDDQEIVIAVVGGSMTAGRGVGGLKQAWPAKLERIINEEFAKHKMKKTITVLNLATAATSLIWALNRWETILPSDSNIDLIIVDYDINDCAFMNDDKFSRIRVQAATELTVRKTLHRVHTYNNPDSSLIKGPAIIFSNVAINHNGRNIHMECKNYFSCYSIGDIRNVVASPYLVPMISQKYALWNDLCDPPPKLWPCTSFCSHPQQNAHKLMAMLFMRFFLGTSYLNSSFYSSFLADDNNDKKQTEKKRNKRINAHPYVSYIQSTVSNYQNKMEIPEHHFIEETKSFEEASCSHVNTLYDSTLLFDALNTTTVHEIEQEENNNNNHHLHHHHHSHHHYSYHSHFQEKHSHVHHFHGTSSKHVDYPTKDTNTFHQISTNSLLLIHSNSSCWQITEDVKGKPGWITQENSCINSTLTFLVNFGIHPILTISYFTTYTEEMGMIDIQISKVPVKYHPVRPKTSIETGETTEITSDPIKLPGDSGGLLFYNKSNLLSYTEDEKNFRSITLLDGLRIENDWFRLSITEVLVIIPKDGRGLISGNDFQEKTIPMDWILPNQTYLIRMKSIDSSLPEYHKVKKNQAIRKNSKFKLYAVSSC
jgi:hypothetical protein